MYYIRSNDNAKIAVYDMNPNGCKTILLVHGWPLSHKMFEYQLPTLLNAGYRVVSIDLRGFGKSDETSMGYTYHQHATDLYHVIKSLHLQNFCLLGFSMGAAIVTKYMKLYKGYGVSKLCLCDAAVPSYCMTFTNPYGQTIESTNQLIALGYNDRPALNEYFGSIFFAQEHSLPFKNWLQSVNDSSSGTGEMKSLISLRDEDVFCDIKCIKVPTAILHGKEDMICSFEMAKLVHENIKTSRLLPFENAGHGAFYDVKEQFNRTLVSFLEGNY